MLKVTDKGAIVALPYGVEGFCPSKHSIKEDGKALKVDETAEFKIIEFSKDAKRIVVSHSRIWEDARSDARSAEVSQKKNDQKATSSAVKKVKDSVEQSRFVYAAVSEQCRRYLTYWLRQNSEPIFYRSNKEWHR